MKNRSGLTPVGQAVLVRPYAVEKTLQSKLIAIPESARERLGMAEQRAQVVAVGSEAWKDEREPRAMIGDHVMISAYAGFPTVGPLDGKPYRVVNARDIFLKIAETA